MNKRPTLLKKVEDQRKNQENIDNLAVTISTLMGANVVHKTNFDKVNKEKQELLNKIKDIEKLRIQLIHSECKLQAFVHYHSQWKPTTKNIEKRLSKLKKENLYLEFKEYPKDIAENLKEAYNCYINSLSMACYIMILRTIEITVGLIYEQKNPTQYDSKGKPIFISASQKLNWVKANKIIGGADYTLAKAFIEARNDSVHELFIPTEKQLLSAFESIISLVNKLKPNVLKTL